MKAYNALVGTVLLATLNMSGREKLNFGQFMILTPSVAGAVGVSYEELWKALAKDHPIPFGAPIHVRLASETSPASNLTGPVATVAMEAALLRADRNVFLKS